MDYKEITLRELEKKAGALNAKNALVGFDGFITRSSSPMDRRPESPEDSRSLRTIAAFGNSIQSAAGKEANFELNSRNEKLDGIGPNLAQALLAFDLNVRYLGALGHPSIHPVCEDFAERTNAVSICAPGENLALEFDDGTINLSNPNSLAEINYAAIVEALGEGALFDAISRADLMAMVNWSRIPNMTPILTALLDRVFPNLGPKEQGRIFLFDLADPGSRTDGDINTALSTISRFRSHGQVTLGLNLDEAQRIVSVLGHQAVEGDAEGVKKLASHIQQDLSLTCVTVQLESSAGCATKEDAWWVDGVTIEDSKAEDGLEDQFRAGFATAQLLGLSTPACVTLAVAAVGTYARTGKRPSIFDVNSHIRNLGT